jgi:hypothetical protein
MQPEWIWETRLAVGVILAIPMLAACRCRARTHLLLLCSVQLEESCSGDIRDHHKPGNRHAQLETTQHMALPEE